MGSSKITTKDLSEPVVEALNTIDTVAEQITIVDSNVDTLLSRLTDTRAGYLDLLANSTNGLAAIKNTIDGIKTSVSSGSSSLLKIYKPGTAVLETLSIDTASYNSTTASKTVTLGSWTPKSFGCIKLNIGVKVTKTSSSVGFNNYVIRLKDVTGNVLFESEQSMTTGTVSATINVTAGFPIDIIMILTGHTVNNGATITANATSATVTGTLV